jgi:hypothetical protein
VRPRGRAENRFWVFDTPRRAARPPRSAIGDLTSVPGTGTLSNMKFRLHNELRYDGADNYDKHSYFSAKRQYYRHLSRMTFSTQSDLLKYFGDSFFHDAELVSSHYDRKCERLDLSIYTLNDLEDINDHRKRNGLPLIARSRYERRPIRYACHFSGVTLYRANKRFPARIMDTELNRGNKPGMYMVSISFSPTHEIVFCCVACKVVVDSPNRIAALTGGSPRIPRCSTCKDRLLSVTKITRIIGRAGPYIDS